MAEVIEFPSTKSDLIDTLARKAGRLEEDEPEMAMHFYKQIALLMAHDVIAMNKKMTTLRGLNNLLFVRVKAKNSAKDEQQPTRCLKED